MTNDGSIVDLEEVDEPDLVEAFEFEGTEEAEPEVDADVDGVGNYDRPEIVHGYIRELRYGFVCGTAMGNLPVPSSNRVFLPPDLLGMSDKDVLAEIDTDVVSKQCRTRKNLLDKEFAGILVAGARLLGLRPLHTLGATVRDLQEALQESPDAHRLVSGAVADGIVPAETPVAVAHSHWATLLALPAHALKIPQTHLDEQIATIQAISVEIAARMAPRNGFAAKLADLLSTAGLSANAAGPRVGLDPINIQGWLNGVTPPRVLITGIRALEGALSAPAGTLTSHVPARPHRIPTDDILTAEVRKEFESLMIPLACVGYDWFEVDDVERDRRIAEIRKEFITSSSYRQLRRAVASKKYRYPKLTPMMESEFEAIAAFKGGKLIPNLKRKLTHKADGKKQGGSWKQSTRDLQKQIVRRLLGFAYELMANDPVALSSVANVGLALFCRADVVQRLMHRMAQRRFAEMLAAGFFRNVEPPTDGMIFISTDVSNLWMIAGWLSEQTGYLRARPPQLTVVPGWLDAEWVARAQADWKSVAAEERAQMAVLAGDMDDCDHQVREPRKNVQALLDLERPLDPVLHALARFDQDRPSFFQSPYATAVHDRDYALLMLWLASRLRRENLTALTYDPATNEGKLRRSSEGRWHIVIPRRELKNANSSAYSGDMTELVMELPDDPALEEALSRWLDGPGSSRTQLHGQDPGTALFPGIKDDTDAVKSGRHGDTPPATMPKKSIASATAYRIVINFSALYLAHLRHRPGIPGVKPFGVHTIRMLVATHILMDTGSYHDAAAALYDDVATVALAYAWISERQKSRLTNRILARSTTQQAPSRPIITYQ